VIKNQKENKKKKISRGKKNRKSYFVKSKTKLKSPVKNPERAKEAEKPVADISGKKTKLTGNIFRNIGRNKFEFLTAFFLLFNFILLLFILEMYFGIKRNNIVNTAESSVKVHEYPYFPKYLTLTSVPGLLWCTIKTRGFLYIKKTKVSGFHLLPVLKS
jgi:hypothetical protein